MADMQSNRAHMTLRPVDCLRAELPWFQGLLFRLVKEVVCTIC